MNNLLLAAAAAEETKFSNPLTTEPVAAEPAAESVPVPALAAPVDPVTVTAAAAAAAALDPVPELVPALDALQPPACA